uniref:Uncharacterized protein n=1 Tax=Rhizophora mucronata TaxID=61149 RepID=A0A2P2PQK8_RHIMU
MNLYACSQLSHQQFGFNHSTKQTLILLASIRIS